MTVLGDLMLDEHIQGAVSRVSPEAPVPVVQVTSRTHHPGGAANVAMNLAALTAEVHLCGVTGDDEAGRILRDRLQLRGIDDRGVVASLRRCTSRKTRVLAHGHHHIVRFDEEVTDALDAVEEDLLWAALRPSIEQAEVLVLSDYAKGVLTASLCRRAIAFAAEDRGIPIVVDPKDTDFTKYRGATVITPNYGEATAAARRVDPAIHLDESDAGAERIGALLQQTYGCSLVLTRGAKGMTVIGDAHPPVHIGARARRVFDVTGAGDTVVAVLAMALAAGLPLSEAAAMSTEAAGHVIELPGTAVVTLEELQRRQ